MRIILMIVLLAALSGCKEPNKPNPIDCPPGYHLGGIDATECILDTTSHEFTWEIYDLGGLLEDVAIIDENDIWVVGDIRPDEGGKYGGAHWDGNTWTFVKFDAEWEGRIINVTPEGIWVAGEHDIWLESGSIFHFDGDTTTLEWVRDMTTTELAKTAWGADPEDIYFGGTQGLLLHYNGHDFRKLLTPTEDAVNDIWGYVDEETGERTIYCAVSTLYHESDRLMLQIHPDPILATVTEAFDFPPAQAIMTLWFEEGSPIYAGGHGLFQRNVADSAWQVAPGIPLNFIWDIAANHANDVIAVGAYGFGAHYNGIDWKVLEELAPYGSLKAVDIQGDVVAAVKRAGRTAIIGKRNH